MRLTTVGSVKLKALEPSDSEGLTPACFQPLAAWQTDVVHKTVAVLQKVQPVIRGIRRASVVLASSSGVGALALGISVALAGTGHVLSGLSLFAICVIPALILLWFRWGLGDVAELAGQLSKVPAAKDVGRQLDELRQSVTRRKVSVLGLIQAVLNVRRVLGEVQNLRGVVTALNPWQILWTVMATLVAIGVVLVGVASVVLLLVF